MTDAKTFKCPSCGSALEPDGDEKEIKCAFCGSTVIVPEELRDEDLDEDEELTPDDPNSPQHVQWLIQTGTEAMVKVDKVHDDDVTRNAKSGSISRFEVENGER